MTYIDKTMEVFIEDLGAKKSMPGGGSAAAYAASMANSLAMMVANFTSGKKKYIEHEADIKDILKKTSEMSRYVTGLVDEDIRAYLPLADSYKMPENTVEEKEKKELRMQECMKEAARVPMVLLTVCKDILKLHEILLEKGSVMLVSDVGVGVELLRAAAKSAVLNIMINVKYIKDEEFSRSYANKAKGLANSIEKDCDRIYANILERLL